LLLFFCLSFTHASLALKDDVFFNELAPIKSTPGVSIEVDSNGHYRGTVLINNVAMPFLIDTGATRIVVPTSMAYSARLPLGKAVQASTANGFVSQRSTLIKSLKIGNMEVKNIDASVNDRLDEVLVGMSFLKLFRMTQDKNVLTLTPSSDVAAITGINSTVSILSKQSDIKGELIRENSGKAYIFARNEVADFKAQYKKPLECYDIQNNATRTYCANAFIKARKAFEALNK
jgi:aspartyl protease family protein